MVQWVKDLVLALLWSRFKPWSQNFCMLQAQPKTKTKIYTLNALSNTDMETNIDFVQICGHKDESLTQCKI